MERMACGERFAHYCCGAYRIGSHNPQPSRFHHDRASCDPIAALPAGITEFTILDGADDFALLAIAMAPVTLGAALFAVSQNPLWAGLGRINLIFIPAILAPSNLRATTRRRFSLRACSLSRQLRSCSQRKH
jgi:hypothetical protein